MDARVAKPVFEFGRFRLDLGQRVLLSDGQIVADTKALSTLGVLAREAGRVVDKDALMQEIWPATFVEENSLARNMSVLRRALGTQPSGLPFIETVAKRGYRLAAPVTQLIPQNGAPERTATLCLSGDSGRHRARAAQAPAPTRGRGSGRCPGDRLRLRTGPAVPSRGLPLQPPRRRRRRATWRCCRYRC